MSRRCELTGKGPMYGNNRPHSLHATRRRWNVNLQKTTLIIDGKKVQVRLSTSALRTLRKNTKNEAKKEVAAPKAEEAVKAEAPVAEEAAK